MILYHTKILYRSERKFPNRSIENQLEIIKYTNEAVLLSEQAVSGFAESLAEVLECTKCIFFENGWYKK